jgi:hypothetical protein
MVASYSRGVEIEIDPKQKGYSCRDTGQDHILDEYKLPDAQISHFEEIEASLHLPDPKDNHVLAAAIKARAEVIVTNNLKDFPEDFVSKYDIDVLTPDAFVLNMIDLDPELAFEALRVQAARLKHPP